MNTEKEKIKELIKFAIEHPRMMALTIEGFVCHVLALLQGYGVDPIKTKKLYFKYACNDNSGYACSTEAIKIASMSLLNKEVFDDEFFSSFKEEVLLTIKAHDLDVFK